MSHTGVCLCFRPARYGSVFGLHCLHDSLCTPAVTEPCAFHFQNSPHNIPDLCPSAAKGLPCHTSRVETLHHLAKSCPNMAGGPFGHACPRLEGRHEELFTVLLIQSHSLLHNRDGWRCFSFSLFSSSKCDYQVHNLRKMLMPVLPRTKPPLFLLVRRGGGVLCEPQNQLV